MNKRRYNQIPLEDEIKIAQMYADGLSSVKLKSLFKYGHITILNAVRRQGIKIRTNTENKTKYTFNHNFFNKIDTERKAYWLGYILADGCVSHKELILCASLKDIEIGNNFLKDIECNNTLKDGFSKGFGVLSKVFRISFRSDMILQDLLNLGIAPKKSNTVKPPLIDKNLLKHFWRGVLDGDGWVSTYLQKPKSIKKGKPFNCLEIGICGNKFIMEGFSTYLDSLGIIHKIMPDKSIWRIKLSGKKAVILGNELYSDCNICLSRKREKYNQYLIYLQAKENVKRLHFN